MLGAKDQQWLVREISEEKELDQGNEGYEGYDSEEVEHTWKE